MIPPETIDKLRKIAGMMASPHEGERLAAVNRANSLLDANKLKWADVISNPLPAARSAWHDWTPPPRPPPKRPPPPPEDEIDISVCPDEAMTDGRLRAYGKVFVAECTAGEYDLGGTDFMESVLEQRHWSEKQRNGLVRSMRRAWMIRRSAKA